MAANVNVSNFLQQSIRRIIRDCEQASLFDENIVDSLLFRIDYLRHVVLRFEGVSGLTANLTGQLLPLLDEAASMLVIAPWHHDSIPNGSTAGRIFSGQRGRPKYNIPKEHLALLIELGFTAPTIGSLLGTSLRTVERRMAEFDLHCRSRYSTITDAELDAVVKCPHFNANASFSGIVYSFISTVCCMDSRSLCAFLTH